MLKKDFGIFVQNPRDSSKRVEENGEAVIKLHFVF